MTKDLKWMLAVVVLLCILALAPFVKADVTIKAVTDQGQEIDICVLSTTDIKALRDTHTDIPDIVSEIRARIVNYVNRCKEQMVDKWIQRVRQDETVVNVPIKIDDFIEYVILRADYKDKADRNAENPE